MDESAASSTVEECSGTTAAGQPCLRQAKLRCTADGRHYCTAHVPGATCAICQNATHRSRQHQLPCGHAFHWPCLRTWLTSDHDPRSCPLCRQRVHAHDLPKTCAAPKMLQVPREHVPAVLSYIWLVLTLDVWCLRREKKKHAHEQ